MNTIQKEIIDSTKIFEIKSHNEVYGQVSFLKSFTGFSGHFDEKPVLPAICLLEIVKCFIEKATEKKVTVSELVTAKFYNVITANEKTDIDIICTENFAEDKDKSGEFLFNVKFSTGGINKKANLKMRISIEP